jgi:predicted nucleic acid-binding protein
MIVVDAAALVDALTGAPGADAVQARIREEELHAPALLDFEFVSALRGLTAGGVISESRAEDGLTDYADLPIQLWEGSDGLRRRAFQLRHNISAYDAFYVALAEALDCPLLTRDARLSRSSGHDARIELL